MLIDNDTYQRETISERPIRQPVRGYCTSYRKKLKISMFCALSQNYIDIFLKNNICIL